MAELAVLVGVLQLGHASGRAGLGAFHRRRGSWWPRSPASGRARLVGRTFGSALIVHAQRHFPLEQSSRASRNR